jgi:hypothetical protein
MSDLTLKLSPQISKLCSRSFLITGSARSGTTILGKLMHSMKSIEYAFEPPMLVSMFSSINVIPEKIWKFLFETYIYEDFLIPSIAGRNLNFNKNDDSSIYRVRTEKDINDRLHKSWRKYELEKNAEKSRIAFKLPSILPYLIKFQKYYQNVDIIIVKREPVEIINSIFNKHWFTNKSLQTTSVIWPNTIHKDMKIPFWVDPEDFDKWHVMSEIDRCAYYVIRQHSFIPHIEKHIKVEYHELLDNPQQVAENLTLSLNLEFGPKTKDILSTIRSQSPKQNLEHISRISPELKNKLDALDM